MDKYSSALSLEPNQGTKELVEKIELEASKESNSLENKRRNFKKCHKNSDAPYIKGPYGRVYRDISKK